jgi:hypothetical protein
MPEGFAAALQGFRKGVSAGDRDSTVAGSMGLCDSGWHGLGVVSGMVNEAANSDTRDRFFAKTTFVMIVGVVAGHYH